MYIILLAYFPTYVGRYVTEDEVGATQIIWSDLNLPKWTIRSRVRESRTRLAERMKFERSWTIFY